MRNSRVAQRRIAGDLKCLSSQSERAFNAVHCFIYWLNLDSVCFGMERENWSNWRELNISLHVESLWEILSFICSKDYCQTVSQRHNVLFPNVLFLPVHGLLPTHPWKYSRLLIIVGLPVRAYREPVDKCPNLLDIHLTVPYWNKRHALNKPDKSGINC